MSENSLGIAAACVALGACNTKGWIMKRLKLDGPAGRLCLSLGSLIASLAMLTAATGPFFLI